MFLMSYFRTDAEALHLALSADGLAWQTLNGSRPVLEGTVGTRTLRDPFLLRAQDGRFHLFSTDGWQSTRLVHTASDDLLHWDAQALLPVMDPVPGARNCWAPECFFDAGAGLYRLIWSSTVHPGPGPSPNDHRIWGAATADFRRYSPAEIFFDPGYTVIDATVAPAPDGYLMAFKDERGENREGTDFKAIRVCRARRGDGPFEEISDLVTPPLTEGPTLFRRDGEWLLFYDHFFHGFFGAASSPDGRVWTTITDRVVFPEGPRHASVLPVDEATADRLRAAFG